MNQMMGIARSHTADLHPVVLEPEFWKMLEKIYMLEGVNYSKVVADMHAECGEAKLAAAIRVFIMKYWFARWTDQNNPTARRIG